MTLTDTDLKDIMRSCIAAIDVCNSVDSSSEDDDKSYPFATGYSRSTMEGIVYKLKRNGVTVEEVSQDHLQ